MADKVDYDLCVIAGEMSADHHGAALIRALKKKDPSLRILGVGGPHLRACGIDLIFPMEKLQTMGFIAVFLSLPRLWRLFRQLKAAILENKPKVVITIDYPDFNLRLAKALHKAGFSGKLCHFISPSVWAWRKNRVDFLAQNYDLLLTIFPFEKKYYEKTDLRTEYVGNPLIEKIPEMTPPSHKKQITLFPGSRRREIEKNLPLFLKVARQLKTIDPHLCFVVSIAHPHYRRLIETLASGFPVTLADHHPDLMKESFVAIAKSGTITLELALYGVPTIVAYAISRLDGFIAQKILRIKLPYYCLVNIIAGKEVFPELIGPHLTEEALLEKTKKMIESEEDRLTCRARCHAVRELLGPKNTSNEAAQLILSLLKE